MITHKNISDKDEDIFRILHAGINQWFRNKFDKFSLPQLYGVMEVHNRNNLLLSAPTGSGKTLTSFLSILNELIILSEANVLENKVYCIYISPLKALNRDIAVNLITPLKEIEDVLNKKLNIRVRVRTGDTTQAERQAMLKKSPHILITTPESLSILLSSTKFSKLLEGIQYCVVDEIHSLGENKRGVDLSLALERLNDLSPDMTRIGLSATAEPIEEIAKFLVGTERKCKIAKVDSLKEYDLKVLTPTNDLINTTFMETNKQLYNLLDKLIQEHKTTLIFTNTRAGTERVVNHLKERFPKNYTENIGAHHGSLSKQHRFGIEEKLRNGELKAIVSSTSLELGIDIGYIDLVICLNSPKSIARMLQRFGRSGHALHSVVKGRIIATDRDDLVECALLSKAAIERKIDRIHIPKNCLDVLAQHIHGMALQKIWNEKEMYEIIKKSYCYNELQHKEFMEIVEYLSGHFVTLEERHVYAKIWYDEKTKQIGKKGKLSRVIHMTNIGTIPDETHIVVKIKDISIGTLDETFLERLKRGDIFVLGGNTYEFLFSRGMVAQVKTAVGKQPTVPSWYSEMLPLSFDLAMSIQRFRKYIEEMMEKSKKEDIIKYIEQYLYLNKETAEIIYAYFREQYLYAKIPNEKRLLIEHYYDEEENKKYVIFHSLYGRRVNDVLSRALAYAIGKTQKRDVEVGINDNGFYLSSQKTIQVRNALSIITSDNIGGIMKNAVEHTEILKRRFRHCAIRALMILKQYKGQRKRVGRQQVSSMILMAALKRINKDFSIIREAKREVLEDLMDIKNAKLVLEEIKSDKMKITEIQTTIPSPFAFNIVMQGSTDILKMEDKVEYIKRMHNYVIAKIGKNHGNL